MKESNRIAMWAALALALGTPVAARSASGVVDANKLRQNLYSTCFVTEDEGW